MVLEGKKEACFNDRNQMPYMQVNKEVKDCCRQEEMTFLD